MREKKISVMSLQNQSALGWGCSSTVEYLLGLPMVLCLVFGIENTNFLLEDYLLGPKHWIQVKLSFSFSFLFFPAFINPPHLPFYYLEEESTSRSQSLILRHSLTIQPSLFSNSWPSYLYLPSTGIQLWATMHRLQSHFSNKPFQVCICLKGKRLFLRFHSPSAVKLAHDYCWRGRVS